MKTSLRNIRSYCHLLRQWADSTAATRSMKYHTACNGRSVCVRHDSRINSQVVFTNQSQLSTSSRLCVSSEQVEDVSTTEEQSQEAEDFVQYDDLMKLHHTKINVEAHFRTKDNDPTKHTIEDEGLFYRVTDEDFEKYISEGQWKEYQKQVKTFQECTMMVRRPALEIFQLVDSIHLKLPPARFILYGRNGSGKSMTLAHVVHKYATDGWLTIHVPNMLGLVRYTQHRERVKEPSIYNESRFDMPNHAQKWLVSFVEQNRQFLEKITTEKEYQWSDRESSALGDSLLTLANLGIDRMKFASDIIGVIFKEIKAQAAGKGMKVLVAVDGVNGLWKDLGGMTDEQKRQVNAQQISLFHHITRLFEPTWTGGVCIGTVCQNVDTVDTSQDRNSVPCTPRYLLQKQGFDLMDPFIPVLVPEYSSKEAYNYIDYLIDRMWITRPRGKTEEGKKELIMLTNKNPLQMMRLSGLW